MTGLPAGYRLGWTMTSRLLPAVRRELAGWRRRAAGIADPVLRRQALASMAHKRFHCDGGASLALLAGRRWREAVSFVVALQTISDYLDNLADQTGPHSVAALRRLHLAVLDAVDPPGPGDGPRRVDYYRLYPHRADAGYLADLVGGCGAWVRRWGVPAAVRRAGRDLAGLYRDLQAYKHAPPARRLPLLTDWYRARAGVWPPAPATAAGPTLRPRALREGPEALLWPEFAAASGSTLAIFALYAHAAAGGAGAGAAGQLLEAYFPWVCGLHIMLDYLIDRTEDNAGGELNLTRFYRDDGQMRERLLWLVARARAAVAVLPGARFHGSVVDGLLAVYLSDPKVAAGDLGGTAQALLAAAGPGARSMYGLVRALRWLGVAD